MQGDIVHVEIPIIDLNKAKEFYEKVFDWDINTEAFPNYALANGKNKVSIGMPVVGEISNINLGLYLQVDNIGDKLDVIKSCGGKVLSEKTLISEEIGYSARFADVFGNEMRLFSTS